MKKDQESAQYLNQLVRELTDITGSDTEGENFDHLSYIIKQVFENGKESAFNEALSSNVNFKNSEIEKVCYLHYQVISLSRALIKVGICPVGRSIAKSSDRCKRI